MYRDPQYEEFAFVGAREGPSMTRSALVLILFTGLIATGVGLYYYRDFFVSIAREREARAQAETLALNDAIRRNALAQELEIQFEPLREELHKLALQAQSFNAEIEAIVGMPFEAAPVGSTRRVDRAILTSEPFVETWRQLLSARITPQLLQDKQQVFAEIDLRIQRNTVSPLDRLRLQELRQWIQQAQQSLQQQGPNIVRLRNLMTELSKQS